MPAVLGERFGQILEPGPGVAPQRHLGREAAPDLLGDDVEVDQSGSGVSGSA